MHHNQKILSILAAAMGWVGACACAAESRPLIQVGDRLAIVGDSITEQKQYSVMIETYLRACMPQLDARVIQLGWSGERAPGFVGRMESSLMDWKPTLATFCYGMNDGGYGLYTEKIGEAYSNAMTRIAERLKQAGVSAVLGTPGVVDSDTWNVAQPNADKTYNSNLFALGQIAMQIASQHGLASADVHGVMVNAMQASKAVYGPTYYVGGGDGVHPAPNGHLCMAYVFLKAFHLDGELGTFTWRWPDKAEVTPGHEVIECKEGSLQIKSMRYPFCFTGPTNAPQGTASMLPFIPFNADLNRFVLKVEDLPTLRAAITWGARTLEFSREELKAGINLADRFALNNPFAVPFGKVTAAIQRKQARETVLVKQILQQMKTVQDIDPKDQALTDAVALIRDRVFKQLAAAQSEAQAAVEPVVHTLVVHPLGTIPAN